MFKLIQCDRRLISLPGIALTTDDNSSLIQQQTENTRLLLKAMLHAQAVQLLVEIMHDEYAAF